MKKIQCPHCKKWRPYFERWCGQCGGRIGNDAKEKGR